MASRGLAAARRDRRALRAVALVRWSRDSQAWIYRMHDEGSPLPTQRSDGIARCFSSELITIKTMDEHIRAAHRGVEE
jgi:hypothetical protein